MILKPLYDYLLVQWLPSEPFEKPGGGRILLNRDPNAPKYGVVIAVGPGRVSEYGIEFKPPVAVGNVVLTYPHPGVEVELDGVKYRQMRFADILCVCEQTAEEREAKAA